MTNDQLCSFVNSFTDPSNDYFGNLHISQVDEALLFIKDGMEGQFGASFADQFSEDALHLFVGEHYFSSHSEAEEHLQEKAGKVLEVDLPLIGRAWLYTELNRVKYIAPYHFNLSDDDPPTTHPEVIRLTFEEYKQRIKYMELEIEKAKNITYF